MIPRGSSTVAVVMVAFLVTLATAYGVAGQGSATGPALTSSVVEVSASQTTVFGVQGVSITYNDSSGGALSTWVYASIQNSAGNTVFIAAQSASFTPNQEHTFFFGPGGLPPGNYTARLFVVDLDRVPLSNTTTVQVNPS